MRKITKPPFMQGGKFVDDGILRNQQGYPLDQDGKIDLEAVKFEALSYERAALNKFKQSNYTQPKKRRK